MSFKTRYRKNNKTFELEIEKFKLVNLEKRAARIVDKAVKYFQDNEFELQMEMEVPHKLHDAVERHIDNKPVVVSRLMFNMNRLRFTSIVKVDTELERILK